MDATPHGYTTRSAVEKILNRTFSEVSDSEFNTYLTAAERQVEQVLGYIDVNSGTATTSSGILTQTISLERATGKVDSYGNLVINVKHGPIHVDANNDPDITYLSINGGVYNISLQLTNGAVGGTNLILMLDDTRRVVSYPAQYVIAAISSITPTSKISFSNLRSLRFWTDISYTGGFDDIPADIALATAYLTADQVQLRDNPSSALSFQRGNYRVELRRYELGASAGAKKTTFQQMAEVLLQPYMRVTW